MKLKNGKRLKRSEVHALQYACCELVACLDTLLQGNVRNWSVRKGLVLTIKDRLDSDGDVFVAIHPVGWPKTSYISCRFLKGVLSDAEWCAYKGELWAPHLSDFQRLAFIGNPHENTDILSFVVRSGGKNELATLEKSLQGIGRALIDRKVT